MTKMIELVEEMRARLNQAAESEHALVRALGEALSRVDQKLLQDVRNMAVDHESRRGEILHELQTLATRIGTFPTQREQVPGVEFGNPTSKPIAAAILGASCAAAHDSGTPSYEWGDRVHQTAPRLRAIEYVRSIRRCKSDRQPPGHARRSQLRGSGLGPPGRPAIIDRKEQVDR